MSRKKSLSPTKISTFLACPVRYCWTYEEPRGRWYIRAKKYYSFGSTLHAVLQRFHDEGDTGVTNSEEAIAAMEESWIDAGFTSAEEMQEAFGEGKEILTRHITSHKERAPDARTIFIEKMFKHDFEDFTLRGRVDRIDEHADQSLEIVDYKSGQATEFTEDDVKNDIAMSTYQMLVKKQFPDRPVRATLMALSTGKGASYEMSASELNEFEIDIQRLGAQIIHTRLDEITPVAKPLCRNCDFLALCKSSEGFELP